MVLFPLVVCSALRSTNRVVKHWSLMFRFTQNIQVWQQWRWACNLWFCATHNMGGLATRHVHIRTWVCFLCFSSNFFENQCGSAEKTNKPPKNKHGTSQRKCEMWWSRSVRQRYHRRHHWWKNSSFITGHCLAAQRKKQNKGRPLEQISSAAFSSLLSLSLQTSERALSDIANGRAQQSDRAMVGPSVPPSLSRSTFCPQKLSHTHTHTRTKKKKKKLFGHFSSETCPWIHYDESLSCSSAPIKATDQAIETGPWFILKSGVPPRTTLKLIYLLHQYPCCFTSSNLSLSLQLSRTVLVHANFSWRTISLNFFVFFLAGGWNQCALTRNTNKTRRALRPA